MVLGEILTVIAALTTSQCERVLYKWQSVIFTQATSFQFQNHHRAPAMCKKSLPGHQNCSFEIKIIYNL